MENRFIDFEKDGTAYSIHITEDPNDTFFLDRYGGRYLVTLFIGNHGRSYFLNNGFKHFSYIIQHYHYGQRDSENFADRLNEVLNDEC